MSGEGRSDEDAPTVAAGDDGARPDAGDGERDPDGEFDWRGWLLVAVIVVSFLVLPVLVTLRPVRIGGFRTTYLVLPLLPAVLLGATAVWVALRSRQG